MPHVHARLVTGAQMARIDRGAMERGVSGIRLMENAGRGAAGVLDDLVGGFQGKRIVVLCGKGNNGGDGFVIADLAVSAGASVSAFLLATEDQVTGDARHHLDRARKNGLEVEEIIESKDLERIQFALSDAAAAVDALLGTGIRGGPRGIVAGAIDTLREAACPILAVDVPSGLDADTGRPDGPCAAATCTVTFGLPKIGQFRFPGRSLCGTLHCVDIGLPGAAVNAEKVDVQLIAAHGCAALLTQRPPDAHKGDCGRVVILAGSMGFTGAAVLSAQGALRSGAGLVRVGIPESLNDILEVKLTEAMTHPLPEVRKPRCLALRARGDIRRLVAEADCVAMGPGLGTHRETVELVRRIVQDIQAPLVLDADGINALDGAPECLKMRSAPTVVTPHPGEFARITGLGAEAIRSDPIGSAQTIAGQAGVIVVLKGAPTIVAVPGGRTYVNPSGNAGMASGGSGDVLTGIIAALIGQGLDPETAACLGVYMHGLAGDLCAEPAAKAGLIAGDIAAALPNARRVIETGADKNRYIQFRALN
ncbi:MAG: NAD(P)H-hydrate dehydratase [Gemmatimonadetes bacterium]|nr:NAD(P)H-hydrate dehydratase [Gemmatimonadota bacterium]